MQASVVISTYNRASALRPTLAALAKQELEPSEYEVVVVDDGSSDSTQEVLREVVLPCALRALSQPSNLGVSAGRNLAMRHAQGELLILLSDDMIVPEHFVAAHLETHREYPGSWVVGGYRQLDSATATPFGRYLDGLERGFSEGKLKRRLADDVWELEWPTARNLSLPRSDLERVGYFDESFRVTCEDQDLAMRAREIGIRFVYNAALECLHNDQAATLERYCEFQRRGARDTVRFCAKYPAMHGRAPIALANGPLTMDDDAETVAKKLLKSALSTSPGIRAVRALVRLVDALQAPQPIRERGYRFLVGLHIFRGWREGLAQAHSLADGPISSARRSRACSAPRS